MKKPRGDNKAKPTGKEAKVILKNELTPEQKQEIKDAFDAIDTDGSGKVDVAELKLALGALGMDSRKDETNRIVEDMDKNKDGQISYDEFLELLTLQITDNDHVGDIKRIYSNICGEKNDRINFDVLKSLCADLGEQINDDEIKEMIEEADLDRDGDVDENEFYNLMKKINVL
eukprot:CAMPEP_0170515634 /NCGR_PEP_ID=MMETSP0209-20121228/2046_1 /TAXON_ID=665100 ORGANISM="Litonotus pictus, Strain P1" /NCGR_SAMPLE_ID=MMETSP0209 /ASSEMBLY_ACC=CAM_ASM_000301 /LENGTH=172 /DNA_ID=CAMNT_0010800211 /DNA_START=5 /DNA_END=523 /DNA_ORIENTATION=-